MSAPDSGKPTTAPLGAPTENATAPPATRDRGRQKRRAQGSSGSDRRNRTERIIFRALPEEVEAIVRLATLADLPLGAYCRTVLLAGRAPRTPNLTRLDRAELARFIGALGRVGNNVNQIARTLNCDLPVSHLEVQQTLRALRTVLEGAMTTLGRRLDT